MFDQTPHDWQQDIAIGDVVLFRFPTTEDLPEGEAPKRRPCLVLETLRLPYPDRTTLLRRADGAA